MTTTTHTSGRTPQGRHATRHAWRRAVADVVPVIAGYVPFGLVLGATIAASDVPNLVGWASSPLIFAGASQLAVVELLDAGAATAVVVATALVINLRHVMYSGAIARWFRDTPAWWRLAAPYLMADPVYTFASVRFPELRDRRSQRVYWATFGLVLLLAWCTTVAAGVLVGVRLPSSIDLGLAVPLVFLALLAPTVVDRPTLAAAVVGAGMTIAADGLPLHLGLMTGAVSGVLAGMVLDRVAGTGRPCRPCRP